MALKNLAEASADVSRHRADVCVVGAGMAGLVIAAQLSSKGIKTVLVESGTTPADPWGSELNKIVDLNKNYKYPVTGRARGPGGSSRVWGGKMIPLLPSDVGERPHMDAPAWPIEYSELQTDQASVEKLFHLAPGSYTSPRAPSNHPLPKDNNSDFIVRSAKWSEYKRGDAWRIFGKAATANHALEAYLGATVREFRTDDASGRIDELTAISRSGNKLIVKADHFVIAAGAIESTRLLLCLQAAHRDRIFQKCAVLGQYFQDHLEGEVATLRPVNRLAFMQNFGVRFRNGHRRTPHFELSPGAQRSLQTTSACAYVVADVAENRTLGSVRDIVRSAQRHEFRRLGKALLATRPELKHLAELANWRWHHGALYYPEDVRQTLHVCIEQTPNRNSRLFLSQELDPLGMPRIAIEWRTSEADVRSFRTLIERFENFFKRQELDRICEIEWNEETRKPEADLLSLLSDHAHPSGSTRMGMDPVESVVDQDLICHEVRNLSVVGASCFPSSGSANPTLTVLMLAHRHARLLGQQFARVQSVSSRMPVNASQGY